MTDVLRIDSVLRLIDREVWIVTAASRGGRGGLVATWVWQASVDRERPVVLVGIAPNHHTADLIDASESFALHLISADHVELAWNFAFGSGRDRDKLADLDFHAGGTGSPILHDCLAWLECRVFARLAAGDRNFYWADVIDAAQHSRDKPLTERELFALASEAQRRQLGDERRRDIVIQAPLHRQWRESLPALLNPKQ
jgi:flavin reductase (DIM6/NTAB) family NADH-FMN oxidoreductase RutF